MAAMGWCPSGRLFEAAACGTPILSDRWEGIEAFFAPDREIMLADSTADTLASLERTPTDLVALAHRARERTLDEHTAVHRARELVAALDAASQRRAGVEA
jgi:spore maturation protein CgeB